MRRAASAKEAFHSPPNARFRLARYEQRVPEHAEQSSAGACQWEQSSWALVRTFDYHEAVGRMIIDRTHSHICDSSAVAALTRSSWDSAAVAWQSTS